METLDNRTKKTILLGIFLFVPLILFWAAPIIRQITETFIDPIPQISILQNILIVLSIGDIAFPLFLEKVRGSGIQSQERTSSSSISGGQKFYLGLFFEVSPSIYGLLLYTLGASLITFYIFIGLSFVATGLWGLYRINSDEYLS